jgi:hypothetical protein
VCELSVYFVGLWIIRSIQCSLDLPFFKGVAKMVDEYRETRNPENHFFK